MKITGRIKIQNGSIKYLDDFIDRAKKLKINPDVDGHEGEISIDMNQKSTRWHQHKYYRGYVLPPIAVASFDGRIRNAHYEMKRQFLYCPVSSIDEIPEKHLGRCVIDSRTMMSSMGELTSEICGYIPSMAVITIQEASEYIKKCETFLIDFLQGDIDKDGMTYRANALMIDKGAERGKQGRKKNVSDVQDGQGQFPV